MPGGLSDGTTTTAVPDQLACVCDNQGSIRIDFPRLLLAVTAIGFWAFVCGWMENLLSQRDGRTGVDALYADASIGPDSQVLVWFPEDNDDPGGG